MQADACAVNEMETKPEKLKEKLLKETGRFGIFRNVEKLYKRLLNKISAKPYGVAIDNAAAYMASKTYHNLLIQVEIRKAQALAEAHRHSLR